MHARLNGEVLVDQQVGRFEVAVDDGRLAGVQVVHAARGVGRHLHPPLVVQRGMRRPAKSEL